MMATMKIVHRLESDVMRSLLIVISTLFVLLGNANAQQETETPEAPPQLAPSTVEETIAEAAENTDLGNSVDDLLETTLQDDEPEVAEDDALGVEEGQQDGSSSVDVDVEPEAAVSGPRDLSTALPQIPDAPIESELRTRRGSQNATGDIGGEIPTGATEEPDNTDLEGTDLEEIEEAAELATVYAPVESATQRDLDKITGRSTDINVLTDTPIVFGALNIEMKACFQTPPELPPESAAFLSITSVKTIRSEESSDGATDLPLLFSGWMFASSPGLSALEHPVYDVWVINCRAS